MTEPQPLQYAGLGCRLIAFMIDALIMLGALLLTAMVLRVLRAVRISDQTEDAMSVWDGLGMLGKLGSGSN